jgi:hypothetical protein
MKPVLRYIAKPLCTLYTILTSAFNRFARTPPVKITAGSSPDRGHLLQPGLLLLVEPSKPAMEAKKA